MLPSDMLIPDFVRLVQGNGFTHDDAGVGKFEETNAQGKRNSSVIHSVMMRALSAVVLWR